MVKSFLKASKNKVDFKKAMLPNLSNLSFGDFFEKLKLEDNLILAHLFYIHYSRSGLTFAEWKSDK